MHTTYRHLKKYFLIYLGLVIYLCFYISVARTGWFDFLFSGAALHDGAKGIDLFQVPKGAWAFWHGGTLSGELPPGGTPYGQQFFSNGNVYHPLFSLTLGSLLTLFDAAQLPYIWLWTKFVLSLLVIFYFLWSFRANKYTTFAVFVLLTNFSIYLELAAWQFQFVLNIFLLLFLIALVKKQSAFWSGILYWLGLLVKPVGILFLPALFFKGRWKIAVFGILLFAASTLTYLVHGTGKYYIDNLMTTISSSGAIGPNQIITFAGLLRYTTHWPDFVYQAIQNGFLLLIVFLSSLKRTHITKAIFLYIVYYLYFYESVFEYQWSTLPYILAICIVCCPEFQTKRAIFCIMLTSLPDCFALLNLRHIDITYMGDLGPIPGPIAWEWMTISKILPLFLLLVCVLAADIKPIFKQLKVFWKAMRQVNERLEVFGEQEEGGLKTLPEPEALPEPVAAV